MHFLQKPSVCLECPTRNETFRSGCSAIASPVEVEFFSLISDRNQVTRWATGLYRRISCDLWAITRHSDPHISLLSAEGRLKSETQVISKSKQLCLERIRLLFFRLEGKFLTNLTLN
jgi:hypothetical protein